jgi:hypothetical protein
MNTMIDTINYGPLAALVGSWQGAQGVDIAPEPHGTEKSPYYETITFEAIGNTTNAEDQVLAVVRYLQRVSRQSDQSAIHDQTGYWIWDESNNTIINSFTIPRGVCVLAGGVFNNTQLKNDEFNVTVNAERGHKDWGIIQSPFMQQKARTVSFEQQLTISNNKLNYQQTMMLEIYGKEFKHTDCNILTRCD